MATLTAWKFDTPEGAAEAEKILVGLSKEQLINIYDAATVEWQPGKKKPKTRQANSLVAAGALGGAFWGLLFGILFFVPLLGIAIGAASGALGGSLADAGIDDDFIDAVKQKVTPGTSALFLLSSDAVLDQGQGRLLRRARRAHPHQPVQRGRGQAPRGVLRGGLTLPPFDPEPGRHLERSGRRPGSASQGRAGSITGLTSISGRSVTSSHTGSRAMHSTGRTFDLPDHGDGHEQARATRCGCTTSMIPSTPAPIARATGTFVDEAVGEQPDGDADEHGGEDPAAAEPARCGDDSATSLDDDDHHEPAGRSCVGGRAPSSRRGP